MQEEVKKSKDFNKDKEEYDLESPITKITSNSHAQALLAFVLTHVILVILIEIINYCINPSDLYNDFSYIGRQGKNFTSALTYWALLHLILYSIVYSAGAKCYNNHLILWLTGLLVSILMTAMTLHCIFYYELEYLVTFALTVENTRLLMKTVSFLVEQASVDDPSNTSITKFTYFLFSPTLIYQHSYLRISGPIKWSRVIRLFSIFLIFCYLGLLAVTRRGLSLFHGPFTTSELLHVYMECIFLGTMCTLALAFGFLHCYLNAFAEILSFADRRFYDDWWNARSSFQFWRRWNLVVHNWLTRYVYKSYIKWKGSKEKASFVVFGVSGVFHEYTTGLALRVWYPIFAVAMVFFSLMRVSRSLENMTGLFPLVIGFLAITIPFSFMLFSYGLEYAASINCPDNSTMSSVRLIPKFFTCIQFK